MKYGILKVEYYKQNENTASISNLGDTCTTKSIEYILDSLNIRKDERIYLDFDELWLYTGEYLICPINTIIFQKKEGHELYKISSKIIPVFLSISYNENHLEDKDVIYLRRFEPIGCRDEQTLKTMRKYGIDAFLNGCMVATFPKRNALESQKKVFFVDVPIAVKKFIPQKIKKDIVFIKQEILSKDIPTGQTQSEWAEDLLERYRKEAAMVVTSRFHAAVLGLALGIPTIIVNEAYTYRFSWLRKLLPFYTRETFQNINWTPNKVDFEQIKKRMIEIAKKRIQETYAKYSEIMSQSEYMEIDYENDIGQIDYYDEALEFINQKWKKNDIFCFSFWGINVNAYAIYEYIQEHYPYAKLVEVYDTYRQIEFEGIQSIKPENIVPDNHYFIFVTSFVAGYVAKELFQRIGISENQYFICNRRYVEEKDL